MVTSTSRAGDSAGSSARAEGASPDDVSRGLVAGVLEPSRYEGGGVRAHASEVGGSLLKIVPKGARVLDVGCGTGRYACFLRDRLGAEVVGLEPSTERAEQARSRGIETYSCRFEDMAAFALPPFDVVLLLDVIEHLAAPASALEFAETVLKHEGLVVASVPNVAYWTARLRLAAGRWDYEPTGLMDATHLRWFTEKTIVEFFARCGFTVRDLLPTVEADMREYRRFPWRVLPQEPRRSLVRNLARVWPRLFALQFVVSAARSGAPR
jgi:2-polyprenyl-3-methyl-5-hydroxy-6-metoxy-1,4-benzoquinol methylase